MTFVWTREANELLIQIYLQQPVVTDHDINEVLDKIRVSLAVVQSEKERETAFDLTSIPPHVGAQLSEIPREEILMKLATLPECPQPGFIKVNWSQKFHDTTLCDYLIQFWELETQCRITEDLEVKFVPDWSKFYKSVLLLNSVVNFSEEGEEDNDIIPWAHTCQERIEDIRRGFHRTSPRRQKPRSSSLSVSQSSYSTCTHQSLNDRGSLLKTSSKISPSKSSLIQKKTKSHPPTDNTITGYNKRSPIMGSTLGDDHIVTKSPSRKNSQRQLEIEQGKIRSHGTNSPGQSPPKKRQPDIPGTCSSGKARSRQNSQRQLDVHGPGKAHSRQSSQRQLEIEQGKIRSHGTHSPVQANSRQNSQRQLEIEQGKFRFHGTHSPVQAHSRQNSQRQLEIEQGKIRSHGTHSPAQAHSRQNSQRQLEIEQGKIRSHGTHSPVQAHSRQNSQRQLEIEQGKIRSHGTHSPVQAHSRKNSQRQLEIEQGKIRSHGTHSPVQAHSRRNSQKQLEVELLWCSSTQSSPNQSPEQSKSRSQGPSPVRIRQNSGTEGLEEKKRGLRSSKKRPIQKELEIFKRERCSPSLSPTQEQINFWGVEEDFLDYDNALSHTSSEVYI